MFDWVYLGINQSQQMFKVTSGMSDIIHKTLIKLSRSEVGIQTACSFETMVTSHLNKERGRCEDVSLARLKVYFTIQTTSSVYWCKKTSFWPWSVVWTYFVRIPFKFSSQPHNFVNMNKLTDEWIQEEKEKNFFCFFKYMKYQHFLQSASSSSGSPLSWFN